MNQKMYLSMNLELPKEVIEALGPGPECATLEAVLLFLVSEEKMPVARAGELLGLDRISAIHWYTSHGFYYPDLSEVDLAEKLRHARKP